MAGLMFILAFIGIVVMFAVRAFPLYNEKMQIVAAMNSVAARPEAASMPERELELSFLKSLQATSNIARFSDRSIKDHIEIVKPEGKGEAKLFRLHYQATNELYKDLHLMLNFDRQIPLQGDASGTGE